MFLCVIRILGLAALVMAILTGAIAPSLTQRVLAQDEEAAAEDAAAEAAPLPTDPAALAVLETNPTTPSEKIRAILLLMKLGQAESARPLIDELLKVKPDDATWSTVVNEFGAAAMLKIGLDESLAPQGKQLADAALDAAGRVARDPARLAKFAKDLSDPSTAVRQTAVAGLRQAGSAAVAPLLAVLADPTREGEHAGARAALSLLGTVGHGALVAALSSPDRRLKAHVAMVAGSGGAEAALPRLLVAALAPDSDPDYRDAATDAIEQLSGRVPSRRAAADYIYRQALAYYDDQNSIDTNAEGLALVWWWDRQTASSQEKTWSLPVARALRSADLARTALELDPGLVDARRLYWAARLEADARQAGLDNPLPVGPGSAHDAAASLSIAEKTDLLVDCLAKRRTVAAAALAGLLGETGDATLLHASGSRPAPLVLAAADDDRRVQFAALGAIMKLGPTHPFSGSSAIPRGLEYFIGSLGGRGAVIASRQAEEGSRLAGLLAQAGFAPEIATDWRDLFRLASEMPDCELVLLDVMLPPRGAADALAELRRDPRTAKLPVAIVARPELEEQARDIARHDPLAMAWVRPIDFSGLDYQLQALEQQAATAGVHSEPAELRLRQASAALDWLAQLLETRSRLYDLRSMVSAVERTLHVKELSTRAAKVLAEIPSRQAQRAVVELASLESSSIAARQAAAEAFATSVGRFGILLTTGEMQRQYDRYNASEFQDEATQKLLASLLNVLEAGRAPVIARGGR